MTDRDDPAPDLEAFAAALGEVREQVSWLLDQQVAAPDPVRPDHRTRTLPEADPSWADLVDWVGWLVGRYDIVAAVPPCWVQHPPMIEELAALYEAWTNSVLSPRPGAPSALDWHEQLDRCLDRLHRWNQHGCFDLVHRAGPGVDVEAPLPDAVRGAARTAAGR